MTAEEYLETRRCNSAVSNKFDMCYMDAAYKAIEMARKEEREKAWKAFKDVCCSKYCVTPCDECRSQNVNIFKELLNQ